MKKFSKFCNKKRIYWFWVAWKWSCHVLYFWCQQNGKKTYSYCSTYKDNIQWTIRIWWKNKIIFKKLTAPKGLQKEPNSVTKSEILLTSIKNFSVAIVVVLVCFYVLSKEIVEYSDSDLWTPTEFEMPATFSKKMKIYPFEWNMQGRIIL